jgi:hypothetical protein
MFMLKPFHGGDASQQILRRLTPRLQNADHCPACRCNFAIGSRELWKEHGYVCSAKANVETKSMWVDRAAKQCAKQGAQVPQTKQGNSGGPESNLLQSWVCLRRHHGRCLVDHEVGGK